MVLMVRLLRWLYWRYAAVGDERLLAKRDVAVGDERLLVKRGAAVLAVPPSAMRFRVVASTDRRVLFESNDSRKVKTRYHDLVDVELWDGNRCRGRR